MGIARSLSCPACAAVLRLSRLPEPGQRVQCPQCAATFTAPAAEAGAPQPQSEPRPVVADRPRRKRAKKRKAKPALFWALIGGGAAVVVLGVVLVIVLSRKGAGQAAVNRHLPGIWESEGKGKKLVLELTDSGRIHPSGDLTQLVDFHFASPLKPFAGFGLQVGRNLKITYRCLDDTRMEIEADYTPLLEQLAKGGRGELPPEAAAKMIEEFTPAETLTFTVTENQLTLTNADGKTLRFRRAP